MKPETATITGLLVEVGIDRQRGRFTSKTIVINDDDSPNPQKPSLVSIDVEDEDARRALANAMPLKNRVSVEFIVRGIEFRGKDGQLRRFNKLLATSLRVIGGRWKDSPTDDEPVGIPPPPSPDNVGDMPF